LVVGVAAVVADAFAVVALDSPLPSSSPHAVATTANETSAQSAIR
jgi:hypothetical protein